jgi:2-polyprenyl-3-methyl-5-hydroxy-6-metoxy-1,4-benzoquinol methylase
MSLRTRSDAAERMDTDCADYEDYRRCLRDLARVNVVTFTHRPMLRWLARETRTLAAFSVLDVASGHGDALRAIHAWAVRHDKRVRLTGIDLNPWALRAARDATPDDVPVTWHLGNVFEFAPDEKFDFIVTSQFTHHLPDDGVVALLRWMEANAVRGWFIGDLHRHWFPYYGFPLLARLALWHRFVRLDGQVSIARAFVPAEWKRLLRTAELDGVAELRWRMPFRLNVSRGRMAGAKPGSVA